MKDLYLKLASVVVYENVANSEVLKSLKEYFLNDSAENYCRFVSALYKEGCNLGEFLSKALKSDDNIYVKKFAAGEEIPSVLEESFLRELGIFSALSKLNPNELKPQKDLPNFLNTEKNFKSEIIASLKDANKNGYGIYAKYGMFRVDNAGKLIPILSPDKISLDSLVGYDAERKQVLDNTKGLLGGKPSANILLCGDAGTGKSSTVKAVANELFSEGIRLIEIQKDQLKLLPDILGEIAHNPLKFILFVDDLSFAPDEQGFGTLKAILEGSAAAKTNNAVIYATSNRRHIVKETFSAREGDEVHLNDTLQETLSLSARFGLTILFSKPNKNLYLQIIRTLAERNNIPVNEELDIKAEAFALGKGGRSARTAEQFINNYITNH